MTVVAKTLGPFHDCTSNQVSSHTHYYLSRLLLYTKKKVSNSKQAITFGKLSDPANAQLIQDSLSEAKVLLNKFADVGVEALAVEIAVCKPSK